MTVVYLPREISGDSILEACLKAAKMFGFKPKEFFGKPEGSLE